MKILDPQCAVLTNSEVLSFMRSHPPRKPDPRVGGYPVTDLRGLWSVQREFTDYTETITPHLLSYPDPPSKFMRTLLQRLQKFNLTKPEVLVMINLGVGVKKAPEARQEAIEVPNEEEEEMVGNGDGDLLDKVERHLDSAEGADRAQAENRAAGHEDVQMQDEQEEDNSDITVLNTIVEEMYDRFTDADIKEILQICGEILGGSENP
ncbi:hypothetical protein EPUS_04773 [Endocarpon pusillum Z07020]|uniref:DNA-directed RNA polymerase III subunit RPC9 n=1 Tax=Endocarpon pusillum (strain Z07020 / HMAS-L-300199) TaxID=1263415 RepID=U1HQL8_ENDPU|nr:uncharacterized protein EPUS_04773 [Endocarpon pusillum Z07020]ERF72720.1 hypothetical protein EPUS_04773 [Endocarpon pusillum Z07020]